MPIPVTHPVPSTNVSTAIFAKVIAVFSSFGLASIVLALLLLVTLLGTLEQLDHGLLLTQVKYFESLLIYEIDMTCCLRAMHWPFGVQDGWRLPVLLPGGYLLMIVLGVNMLLGGIIRLKKELNWLCLLPLRLVTGRFSDLRPAPRRVGVLISHLAIVFMLFAGVVSLYFKKEGAVWVKEGRTVNEFQSFHKSVIEIERIQPKAADGKRSIMVIPDSHFTDLTEGKARTFTSSNLPFDLVIMNYFTHCEPRRDQGGGTMVVDGIRLQEMARKDPKSGKPVEHENLLNGAYAKIVDKKNRAEQTGILWRAELAPWTFKVGSEEYAISIGRRTYALPFEVTLEKFIRETHPGTDQARRFSSQVLVKHVDSQGKSPDSGESRLITMNQPLRHGGFAFFQSSFDAEAAEHGGTQSSMFQVVSNPSDNWPLYSLIAAGIGMLIHFIWSLGRFISRENKVQSAAPVAAKASATVVALCGFFGSGAFGAVEGPTISLNVLRNSEVVENFRALPVQDAGRIKPLDTVARFTLLRFSGKQTIAATDTGSIGGGLGQAAPQPLKDPISGASVVDENGKPLRLSAIEWLLVSWYRPALAKEFRVFTVDNSDAIILLGLQGKGKRDRYSFNEISPAQELLIRRATELQKLNPDALSPEQRALSKLAADFFDYALILAHQEFDTAPFGDQAKTLPGPLLEEWEKSGERLGVFLPKLGAYIKDHPEAGAPMANPWLGRFYSRTRAAALMSLNPRSALRLFPPQDRGEEVWQGPGPLISSLFENVKLPEEALKFLDGYGSIARAADDAAFKSASNNFIKSVKEAAADRGEGSRVALEVRYHKTEYFYQSLLWFFGALIVAALSWLGPRSAWGRWCSRTAMCLLLVGGAYSVTGIVVRCIIMQRPPVTNLYETIIFITAAAVVFGLVAEWITRKGIALAMAALAGTAGMFLSIRFMNMESADTMRQLEAVLITTFWLATHVPIINLGYAAGMVAAILSMFYFGLRFLVLVRVLKADRAGIPSAIMGFKFMIFNRLGKAKSDPDRDWLSFKDINRIAYAFVCAGLFLSLVGTVLGGIWANYSWGRFWGWDPKENGALMIVLMNLVILHARLGGYIREIGFHACNIILGMITVFSWFGTNQLGIGLHSYGQLGGVWWWIYAFWASQTALLALAVFLRFWDSRKVEKKDDVKGALPNLSKN